MQSRGRSRRARSSRRSANHRVFWARARLQLKANWSPSLCSGCANSAGSRAAPSRSKYRWADGRFERFAEIAAEFVRLKVDVILTSGPSVFAAKQATSVIPIVFATVADPLSTGLVASLARPGGNVTGLSVTSPELASKRLELLREVVPGLRRLAIMANVDYPPAMRELDEVEIAAHPLGIETIALKIRQAADIAPAFEALKGRAEALYVVGESLTGANQVRINSFALAARLPTMHAQPRKARNGRSRVLWTELPEPLPARRRLCRQDFARSEAGRHPGRAADASSISSSI